VKMFVGQISRRNLTKKCSCVDSMNILRNWLLLFTGDDNVSTTPGKNVTVTTQKPNSTTPKSDKTPKPGEVPIHSFYYSIRKHNIIELH